MADEDFVFDLHRVVVETDGYRYHGTRRAFERDRDRDAVLTRAGYRALRFSHRQVTGEADVVVRTLGAALSTPPTSASPAAR